MRLAAKLAAVAAAAAFSAGTAALACSCMMPRSAAEQLQHADLAFRGKVTGERLTREGGAVTTFQVLETIKGRAPRTVQVSHELQSAACGLRFKRGATVLVLAHREEGRLGTGSCSQPRFPVEDFRRAARGQPVPTLPPQF